MAKKLDYNKIKMESVQNLQRMYQEVSLLLGQEIGNLRRALRNQKTLREQQEEIEKAFVYAQEREAAKKQATTPAAVAPEQTVTPVATSTADTATSSEAANTGASQAANG